MENRVSCDMLVLRQEFGDWSASYGIACLTGGYSQFFGLGHTQGLGENNSWVNSLRYDRHQLDSRRSISFEDVRMSVSRAASIRLWNIAVRRRNT
ncbi:hypothetical protein [Enterobacter asburiae]|uniref:hypothetical protein n=2 Tax=Enterobacter asburiae TaxID=61645 RepID=UPI0012D3EE0B|nr:hypothetical protein [Enterobacter asburiae]